MVEEWVETRPIAGSGSHGDLSPSLSHKQKAPGNNPRAPAAIAAKHSSTGHHEQYAMGKRPKRVPTRSGVLATVPV
ncbi:hypothetical protein CHELA41_24208 [Hyphomicrobiales bacterium]|nr:hypothetical protein CHELA41_24208 [Hyphomicrobiales bacterium]